MKEHIEQFLQEINTMSRMAVIENAPITSQMLQIYSYLTRYRWNEIERDVSGAKEMKMVLKYCEWYNLKNNQTLTCSYKEGQGFQMVFIPHYTLMVYIKTLLDQVENQGAKAQLLMECKSQGSEGQMICQITAPIDFHQVEQQLEAPYQQHSYESWTGARQRWQHRFGEGSFQIITYAHNKNKLQIVLKYR